MPVSARKSSLGASRLGPQKYIRYRADDLQHGKRTGIAVGYVERGSDEFEPFDKVIGQADLRTPPKPHMPSKKKKTQKTPVVEEFDDEYGEMSMELEESNPYSPAQYLANGMRTITSSVQRTGSSLRLAQRRSDIDFDRVPSPRRDSYVPAPSTSRSNGHARPSSSSHLSRSVVPAEDEYEPEPFDLSPPPEDFEEEERPASPADDSDLDRTPQAKQGQSTSRPRANLPHIRQRSEEGDQQDDDEVETRMIAKSSKAKERKQQLVEEQDEEQDRSQEMDVDMDMDMEPEIAQGLDDVDNMPVDQFDDEAVEEPEPASGAIRRERETYDDAEMEQQPSKKSRRGNGDENEGHKKPKGRPRKQDSVLREVVHDQNVDDNGLRRGARMRYKPLEWWRCEKVVYGRRESGTSLVPTIKEIRRLPKEDVHPLGAKHKRKRPPRSKSQSVTEAGILDSFNPEEGWDDETEPMGIVLQYPTDQEVEQRVAFTTKMLRPKPAANADFSFQKIFGDGNFMAAGQLVIPPGGSKPTKGTKDNTFIFYVIEGAVTFKVHRTSFILASGGMFLVPRGNMYHIQNISDRDAKLFFAQARKVDADEGTRSPSAPGIREESVDEEIKDSKLRTKSTKKRK